MAPWSLRVMKHKNICYTVNNSGRSTGDKMVDTELRT